MSKKNSSKRRDHGEEWSGPTSAPAAGTDSENSSLSKKVVDVEKAGREDESSSVSLQPYTNTIRETTRTMAEAQKMMQKLNDLYVEHMQEIEEVPSIHRQLSKLQNECMHKNRKIHRQKQTIIELQSVNKENEFELEVRKARMKEAEEELEKKKQEQIKKVEKAEKSLQIQKVELLHEVEVQKTQMKTELETEFNRQKNEQEEKHKDLTKKLEDEHSTRTKALEDEHSTRTKQLEDEHSTRTKQLEDEHSTRTKELEDRINTREAKWENEKIGLEADNKKLSEDLDATRKRVEELLAQLKLTKDDLDDMKEAKIAYKKQVENLEAELHAMQSEFGLTTETTDFYKEKFAEIATAIDQISSESFGELPTDDTDKIQRDLIAIDKCFQSIPISDTDASRDLRVAYAQRTISTVLCANIWQPFSSEMALSYPNSPELLDQIYQKLAKSDLEGNRGREASVWKVLTMRTLRSLDRDLQQSQTQTSQDRAHKAVNDMLTRLSPLVSELQKEQIEKALLDIAISAVNVWNVAQTDVLKLTACATLNPAERNTWRSAKFDPPSSREEETDGADSESSTVFTLFPKVVAYKLPLPAKSSLALPGTTSAPEQKTTITETSICPGAGLHERAELVAQGKEEEEDRKAYLQKVIGQARRALAAKGRRVSSMNGGQSAPMAGTLAGPIVEIFQ